MMSCSIVLSIGYYPKKTIFSLLDNMHHQGTISNEVKDNQAGTRCASSSPSFLLRLRQRESWFRTDRSTYHVSRFNYKSLMALHKFEFSRANRYPRVTNMLKTWLDEEKCGNKAQKHSIFQYLLISLANS
jgi:hypothetical protein